MSFKQVGSIRYYTFDIFNSSNLVHAILTRQGGVSPSPWQSLNFGGTVGDERERVISNRSKAYQALGFNQEKIFDVWQVHSEHVICTSAPRQAGSNHEKADGIITNKSGLGLLMLFADCVPIMLYDPIRHVVGIVHAGWKGTVSGIAGKAIHIMHECYGTNPRDILAGIGPSIGPDHYQVRGDVVNQVTDTFGEHAGQFIKQHAHSTTYDLWECNRWILQRAGVNQIEVARICTACHPEDWFTHRGEGGRTGRFGALIGLKEESV